MFDSRSKECDHFSSIFYCVYRTGSGRIVIDDRKDEGKSYLTITNVTDLDNGMYQCTADNELDILYSSARLSVFGMFFISEILWFFLPCVRTYDINVCGLSELC